MKALVTAGPTFEPIDPVRFIGNRSSGKQGYAIAQSLRDAGFDTTLITGPTSLPDPEGITTIRVETAADMLSACEAALPADIAICTAAVADWTPAEVQPHKIKKRDDKTPPTITLKQNPDILHTIATHTNRPRLVIGFAAETDNLLENARAKLKTKQCDWILANDVSENVFGSDKNHVYRVTQSEQDDWQEMDKTAIAEKLVTHIKQHLAS